MAQDALAQHQVDLVTRVFISVTHYPATAVTVIVDNGAGAANDVLRRDDVPSDTRDAGEVCDQTFTGIAPSERIGITDGQKLAQEYSRIKDLRNSSQAH